LPGQWVASFVLTRLHTPVRVIVCSLISNMNLAFSDGASLDYCDVTIVTSDYGLAIITLDMIYFLLSYWLTPSDDMYVLYKRRVDSGDTGALLGPHLHQEWALRCFGPRILVPFWCEDTGHVESPDARP
jgi:hypothetical protein